ncbi:hypothetical protein VMCG_09991 [Cytospora schulzeri]|uniref:Nephrocystin 3-like N-terminal domain-containing protein n=1 Tax=Cytospora schulzeri TaxID=448051 RepID=A0A423VJ02_9PEZI|nr:hypothetical protein VMCG_09991 [Valsa malicola]
MPLSAEKTVFRLRRCPWDKDVSGLQELLSNALQDVPKKDIRIQSLAADYGVCNTTKTATLMFRKLPSLVTEQPKQKQWKISLDDGSTGLLLDIDFGGFTPLNDPEPEKHEFDCIVISGLASHPFGSWQPKGNDKDYMWIRDTLPRQLPHIRAILYGYDTTLVNSYSFQSIPEVANTLIDHLMPAGWQSSEMKPLVFLAHSLGGIVLKQMLVLLNKSENLRQLMLNRARGGILFGVPSQGMTQGPLLAMVKGRPNETLVRDLAKGSPFLRDLDIAFSSIGHNLRMGFHWAYETKESRTVEQLEDGSFSRTGPRQVLVTRESATRGLCGTYRDEVFNIDEDHSEMVKFRDGSSICELVVLKRLESICKAQRDPQTAMPRRMATVTKRKKPDGQRETTLRKEWTTKDFQESFYVPEWDGRFNIIEERSPGTCEWFMEDWRTPFFDWRQKHENGLFWIHGKPGSGKSTLMKYIATDSGVDDYLGQHVSGVTEIKVRHFFHGRGTVLQKSFEGMLKSILYQIIRYFPSLAEHLRPMLRGKPRPDLHGGWTVNELQRCLHLLLNQNDDVIRILILIDAVDEYDGGPEFMAKFIKGLLDAAGERTCVKVLVSSVHWSDFLDEDGSTPSITLEDYNHIDISLYCQNRVSHLDPDTQKRLEDLIPDIVERAQGLFIWAQMALEQLIVEEDDEQAPELLQSLPVDLSDYYTTIIQNIKFEDRRDAYVMFQFAHIMANPDRSECKVHFMDLLRALAISRCSTYKECKRKLKELDSRVFPGNLSEVALRAKAAGFATTVGALISLDLYDGWLFEITANHEFIEEQINRISVCSGGLIQILRPKARSLQERIHDRLPSLEDDVDPWTRCVQFSHQTVKDFVETPKFKELLFDDEASSVLENGYSFLAKTYLTRGRPELAENYCHLAEETTGQSLAEFVKTMDKKAFDKLAAIPFEYRFFQDTFWCGVMLPRDPLSFAVSYDLSLCAEDLIREDPGRVKNTPHALLKGWPFFTQVASSHCRIINRLLQEGYTLEESKKEFQDMMWIIGAMPYNSKKRASTYHPWLGPFMKLKAGILLEMGQDPNVLLYGQREMPDTRVKFTSVTWRAMHVADADFAEVLVRHGADVNLEDERGNTPLDWLLAHQDKKNLKARGLSHELFLCAPKPGVSMLRVIHSKIMFLIPRPQPKREHAEEEKEEDAEQSYEDNEEQTDEDDGERTVVDDRERIGLEDAEQLEEDNTEQSEEDNAEQPEEVDPEPEEQDPYLEAIAEDLGECLEEQDTRSDEEEVRSPTESTVAFSIIGSEIFSTGPHRGFTQYQTELEDELEEIELFLQRTGLSSSADSIQEEVKPRRLSKFFKRLSVNGTV